MTKRILPLLFLIVGSVLRLSASAAYPMYLDPFTQTVNNGDTVQLTLRLPDTPALFVNLLDPDVHNATELQAFGLDVIFNPAILQLLSVDEGSLLSSDGNTTFFFGGLIDNTFGSATFISDARSGSDGIIPLNGGDLLLLTFQAIAPTIGTTITVQNGCLQNAFEVNNGSFTCEFSDVASDYGTSASVAVNDAPEPSTALLFGLAVGALLLVTKRHAKKSEKGIEA